MNCDHHHHHPYAMERHQRESQFAPVKNDQPETYPGPSVSKEKRPSIVEAKYKMWALGTSPITSSQETKKLHQTATSESIQTLRDAAAPAGAGHFRAETSYGEVDTPNALSTSQ